MDIIIVGCGKVGFTLVEQLSNEDHNIVVIDEKPEKVQYITDRLDVMGIVGNGINHKTLLEAGIATADLLIAVDVYKRQVPYVPYQQSYHFLIRVRVLF